MNRGTTSKNLSLLFQQYLHGAPLKRLSIPCLMILRLVAPQFEFHERAFLQEKRIGFIENGESAGKFILEGKQYRKTEHKIMFLVARFGSGIYNSDLDQGYSLWQSFLKLKESRDSVVHPRTVDSDIMASELDVFIETAKQVIAILSREVWKQEVVF